MMIKNETIDGLPDDGILNGNDINIDSNVYNSIDEKDKISVLLKHLKRTARIESDNELLQKMNEDLYNRSQTYSNVLNDYEKYIRDNIRLKKIFKLVMFFCSMHFLIIAIQGSFIVLTILAFFRTLDSLTVTIPLIISLLTVLFVIPKIVSNYLFNKNEERYMVSIFNKLIEYDLKINPNFNK